MIDRARTLDAPVDFAVGDVTRLAPGPRRGRGGRQRGAPVGARHPALLRRWAGELPPGGWLAFQVPGNFAGPSHRALREVAADRRWAATVRPLLREAPVDDPTGYADRC